MDSLFVLHLSCGVDELVGQVAGLDLLNLG